MADDKRGRDKKAADAERSQQSHDIATDLARGDESEPTVETREVGEIEAELDSLTFPATGADVVAAVGDRTVGSTAGSYTVEELIPDTEEVTFDSPSVVTSRIQRPTVAAAIKRVAEASKDLPKRDRLGSQRAAYVKTFEELEAIDADDDDEVVRAITDWIVGYVRENDDLPSSREVRRQSAKICRAGGYQIRENDWLGI